ncbi:MAG TPA: YqgE/AlgH family protein, partial [Saprospiraceae bacterium]|nr:YqgE/AlgH family protein [Saprospiraceae bacterium]
MVNYEIKNGIILLAEPFMLDPNFRRATVLLCEHSPEGSVGFVTAGIARQQVAWRPATAGS